jgi:hypothetical protein
MANERGYGCGLPRGYILLALAIASWVPFAFAWAVLG